MKTLLVIIKQKGQKSKKKIFYNNPSKKASLNKAVYPTGNYMASFRRFYC